jgi:hypothetical protein
VIAASLHNPLPCAPRSLSTSRKHFCIRGF